MKNRIYIVGMGPGKEEMMTGEALKALEEADVIVGYPVQGKGAAVNTDAAGGRTLPDVL